MNALKSGTNTRSSYISFFWITTTAILFMGMFRISYVIQELMCLCIMLVGILSAIQNKCKSSSKNMHFVYIWILFFVYNIFSLIESVNSQSLFNFLQENIYIIYFITMSMAALSQNSVDMYAQQGKRILWFVAITSAVLSIVMGQRVISGSKFLLLMSYFLFVSSKNKYKVYIMLMLIFACLESRSNLLALSFIILTYWMLQKKLPRLVYDIYFFLVAFLVVYWPHFYVWLFRQPIAHHWSDIILKYSGKTLFSGRQILWEYLFEQVKGHELFGLGAAGVDLTKNAFGASTHNLVVFLYVQGGYFLVFIVLLFLFTIWRKMCEFKENENVALSSSFLIGIMILSSFDLLFLVNNFVISFAMWFILSIGIQQTNAHYMTTNNGG